MAILPPGRFKRPNRPAAAVSRDVQVLVGIVDGIQQSAVIAVERMRARVAAVDVNRPRQAGGGGGPAPMAATARADEVPAGLGDTAGLDGDDIPVRVARVLAEGDAKCQPMSHAAVPAIAPRGWRRRACRYDEETHGLDTFREGSKNPKCVCASLRSGSTAGVW
jgi:hypothetical protein